MKHTFVLPLMAVLVVTAAMTGTIRGTVIVGAILTGALITAHVLALRAGRWRVAVFAFVFTALPVALAVAIGDAAALTLVRGGETVFDEGRITVAGLRQIGPVFAGLTALALAIDALAGRFLPR